MIVGMSGCGKSWVSVVSALNAAFNHDMRVLFISMENGLDSIENRMDAYYSKVPYGKRRQGNLEFRSYDEYLSKIKGLENEKGDIFIDASGKKTVSDILGLSEKYQVDLVVVDGAYLVTPSKKGTNNVESLTALAYDFQYASKAESQEKTAWLISMQLNPTATGAAKEMSMNIRNCKEFFIIANTCMTLTAEEKDRLAQRIKISMGKDRERAGVQLEGGDSYNIFDDKVNMSLEEIPDDWEDEEFEALI